MSGVEDALNEFTDDEDFLDLYGLVAFPRNVQTFRERTNNFIKWDDNEFRQRFRLSKEVVSFLIEEISDSIRSTTNKNHALSPEDMVFVTLRFLATGSFLQLTGDVSGIDKSTASRVVAKVLRAIALLYPRYIKMPTSDIEIQKCRQEFFNIAKFPRCIGALDCTHVKIQSPGGEEAENFRNRKGFFSFNVQAVCNAKLQFTDVVCRWPGSSHDSTIFNNSNLRAGMENGNFGADSLLVGDSGYAIRKYLITPLRNPATPAEQLFNEAQIRTRNPIERCFGVWKRRFPILAYGIRLKMEKVEAIVIAAAVLHNIACQMNDTLPLPQNMDLENVINIQNMPLENIDNGEGNVNLHNATRHALVVNYFQGLLP